MSIPTYDKFIEPILRYLAANPDGAPTKDAYEAAAEALHITDAQKDELLPSGMQPIYKNRAGWAHDRLKRAGFSSSPRRGFWKLTEKGLDFNNSHSNPLTPDEVEQLALSNMDVRLRPANSNDTAENVSQAEDRAQEINVPSPDERLEIAIEEIKASASEDLREAILGASPRFFEFLVLDVLLALGYGGSKDDLQHVGQVSDGGIDGIISLDKLGLEKVYIQAKRWQDPVGREVVQSFYGALAGKRATKGVLITLSVFTRHAIEFAQSVEKIVLIDGKKLSDLMIEYGVGVAHRVIKIPKIDHDYFEE